MCKSVSGIYKININNKCYIGSAVNIKHRWMRHKTQLINQTHHSILLQRAYNKYQDITFEIMEECPKEELIKREQFWIDTLAPAYNVCKIAGSTLGCKLTEEQLKKRKELRTSPTFKEKLSKAAKKRGVSEKTRNSLREAQETRKKIIYEVNLDGEILREFKGIAELARYNKNYSNIHKKLDIGHFSNNLFYCYKETYSGIPLYKVVNNQIKRLSIKDVPIAQYTKDMVFIKSYVNQTHAARELGVSNKPINGCLKGHTKSSHGFIWKYMEDVNNEMDRS